MPGGRARGAELTPEQPPVPPHLLENWADWRLGDPETLAADVRARCAAAAHAWDLRSLCALPGGAVAFVLGAVAPSGEAVLKLSPRPAYEPPSLEGEALVSWATQGAAPRVLGSRDEGHTLLLERIRPGRSLRETGASGREIIETTGTLCRALHGAPPPAGVRSLAEHARADGWFAPLAGTPEHDLLTRLTTPAGGDRLLHLDLHWLNVLEGPRGWVAIDPKPCVGDPCADVWAFFDGPPRSEMPDRPGPAREYLGGLIDGYAQATALDRARLTSWIRIRALIALGQGDPSAAPEPGLTELAETAGALLAQ